MLYTPVPGTPLYAQMQAEGRLLDDVDLADIHGQRQFNFQHAAVSREQSKVFLDRAFERDFTRNGPSLYRLMHTTWLGWQRYKDDPDPRVRGRIRHEAASLWAVHGAALYAMEHYLREEGHVSADRVAEFRAALAAEGGLGSRLVTAALGPILHWAARRDAREGACATFWW